MHLNFFDLRKQIVHLRSKLVVNAGYLWLISITGALSGYIFWVLAARFNLPAEIGLSSSGISVTQLLSGIALLGLGSGLVRYIPETESVERLINSAINITILTSGLTSLVYILGLSFWSPGLASLVQTPMNVGVFIVLVIVTTTNTILQMVFLGFRQVIYAFWSIIILNIVRLFFILVFGRFGPMGIMGSVVFGCLVSNLVGIFAFLPRVKIGYKYSTNLVFPKFINIVVYSSGNFIADLLSHLPVVLAPVIALERFGSAQSAHSYVAWMIGSVIAGPGLAFSQSSFAEGSHSPAELPKVVYRAGVYTMLITVLISFVIFIGAGLAVLPFGPEYAGSTVKLLRWLSLSAPFVALNGLFFSIYRILKKIKFLIILSLLIFLITIFSGLLRIENLGIISMGVGWFISQVAVFIICVGWLAMNRKQFMRISIINK